MPGWWSGLLARVRGLKLPGLPPAIAKRLPQGAAPATAVSNW